MSIDRRRFVQTTLGAAAALGAVRSSRAAAAGVQDVRVAQIGFNNQGSGHIESLRGNLVALCDVDQKVLAAKVEELKTKYGKTVETFTDYRKLVESDKIDAVSIATPNHTHALIAIAAIQAGKDVYVEKPVCHNIWEGRQLVAATRRHGRVVQCGTQSRSSPALKQAAQFVHSGQLGAVRYALGTCYKPRPSIGKSETPFQFPAHIDRELWIGPAADEPFYRPALNSQGRPNPHYDWHWDFNTGNGDLGNQGIHQMDIARWFLGEKALAPRTLSIGGRLGYDDAGNTANTQVAIHSYEKAPLVFEVRGLPRKKSFLDQGKWDGGAMDSFRGAGIGVVVQCEGGYVLIPSYTEATAFDLAGKVVQRWSGEENHHANWLKAIAAGDPRLLNAEILEGHLSSCLCHTANVSHRVGRPVATGDVAASVAGDELLSTAFDRMCGHLRANGVDLDEGTPLTLGGDLRIDPTTETFVDDAAATKLRSREYRAPFVVPDVEGDAATHAAAGG